MLNNFISPLILDTDGSILPITDHDTKISLRNWEEIVRFGCTLSQWRQFKKILLEKIPTHFPCAFIGSGDFHHLTLLLLQKTAENMQQKTFNLLVFDNHPDNMRYIFGIHCGSWISYAAALPFIRQIFVAGITSTDITYKHCWENRLLPFYRKKLRYLSINTNAEWLNKLFPKSAISFSSADEMSNWLRNELQSTENLYLSVDKDVFSKNTITTNWDQGVLEISDFEKLIKSLHGKIIGADITGDMSAYVYKSRFKNFLSKLDGQEDVSMLNESDIRKTHQKINKTIWELVKNSFQSAQYSLPTT